MTVLGWPYAETSQTAFWGPPTSRSNFCEEDYIITTYIGEFFNTLTNSIYVIYAIVAIQRMLARNRGADVTTLLVRSIPYVGLAIVGIFSAIFHAGLKYEGQMLDDLSMHVATLSCLYQAHSYRKTPSETLKIGLTILAGFTVFAIYHCATDELLVHELGWALSLLAVGLKVRAIATQKVKSPDVKKRVKSAQILGLASFVLGYALWRVDHHFCPQLTTAKRWLGLPMGAFLELHGWWHALTGVGAYTFMALVEWLTDDGPEGDGPKFAWPVEVCLGMMKEGHASDLKKQE